MTEAEYIHAIVFFPKAPLGGSVGDHKLITLHNDRQAAVEYFCRNREELLKSYDIAIDCQDARQHIPMAVVKPESLIGSTYAGEYDRLRKEISAASGTDQQCLQAHYANPDNRGTSTAGLLENEINKIVANAAVVYVELPDCASQRNATPAKDQTARKTGSKLTTRCPT